ncbi:MAG TPA: pirin family protein [Nocardioidaceae bacterium]|nr:pirin family protein [Nocardioidaceae bacterium]
MGDGAHASDTEMYGGTVAAFAEPESMLLPGHDVPLGRYTTVRRLLPQRQRRMVGAWCFVDHFGPDDVSGRPGMQVPPHPHTGLQTVTWLVEGEIVHRDSLGSHQPIVPGQLNLMTSGHGIAHSEQSPPNHPPGMHGLQLWVALPDGARGGEPRFEHHPTLPVLQDDAATVTVVVGELAGERSPAQVHTPLVGAEVVLADAAQQSVPLDPTFEYAVLSMAGEVEVAGVRLASGSLLYLGEGRTSVSLDSAAPARLFLLGGEPFDDPLVMWWNFVARSHEEIAQAREDWTSGRRFGSVAACEHDPLPAPALPNVRLKARDRHGTTVG